MVFPVSETQLHAFFDFQATTFHISRTDIDTCWKTFCESEQTLITENTIRRIQTYPRDTTYASFIKQERSYLQCHHPDLKLKAILNKARQHWKQFRLSVPLQKSSDNPYIVFCRAQRPRLRAEHPTWTFAQLQKALGQAWKQCKSSSLPSRPNIVVEPSPLSRPNIVVEPPSSTSVVVEPSSTSVVVEPSSTSVVVEPSSTSVVVEPSQPTVVVEPPSSTSVEVSIDVLPVYEEPKMVYYEEALSLLKEYEHVSKKTGEITRIPLVATPWHVKKGLADLKRQGYLIVYNDNPTPPPTTPNEPVVEEDEDVSYAYTYWNDFTRNYYTHFLRHQPLSYLVSECKFFEVGTGRRNQMIERILEMLWFAEHQFVRLKYGLDSDADVRDHRLLHHRPKDGGKERLDAFYERYKKLYGYLENSPPDRRPHLDYRFTKPSIL